MTSNLKTCRDNGVVVPQSLNSSDKMSSELFILGIIPSVVFSRHHVAIYRVRHQLRWLLGMLGLKEGIAWNLILFRTNNQLGLEFWYFRELVSIFGSLSSIVVINACINWSFDSIGLGFLSSIWFKYFCSSFCHPVLFKASIIIMLSTYDRAFLNLWVLFSSHLHQDITHRHPVVIAA